VHLWGTRKNKRKAKGWITAHAPALEKEFAVVGFGGRKAPSVDDVQSSGLAKALGSEELVIPEELLKEKTAQEYSTYATGRQNVAFVDFKLSLFKRYNPIYLMGEYAFSFFFDSMPTPVERMEATLYAFDGKEKELVPVPGGKQGQEIIETRSKGTNSSYDGFVWAVVNKDVMRRLREDRYDISLTSTKDHSKLPSWATVMSESAEVSELLITPELIKAVGEAGEALEYLIVTDQPLDKPNKYVKAYIPSRASTELLPQIKRNDPQKTHQPLPETPLLLLHHRIHLHHPPLHALPPPSRHTRPICTLPARSNPPHKSDPRRRNQKIKTRRRG